MFEKEIQFITDFNLNKIKRLGSFFTLDDLAKAKVHPAIVQYVSAEIDYLIFLDRQSLLLKSAFDYSGLEIAQHFFAISQEIKKNKLLPYEEVKKIIQQAVTFQITYLLRPVWTLKKFVFDATEVRSQEEVKLFFNYLYFYDYYKKIFLTLIEKKQLITISIYEFESLLEKIQNQLLEQQMKNVIENALLDAAEFLNTGEVTKTKLSIETLEIFLKDKGLHSQIFKIKKLLSVDPKQKFELSEIKLALYSSVAVEDEEELPLALPKDESQLDIFKPAEEALKEDETQAADLLEQLAIPQIEVEHEVHSSEIAVPYEEENKETEEAETEEEILSHEEFSDETREIPDEEGSFSKEAMLEEASSVDEEDFNYDEPVEEELMSAEHESLVEEELLDDAPPDEERRTDEEHNIEPDFDNAVESASEIEPVKEEISFEKYFQEELEKTAPNIEEDSITSEPNEITAAQSFETDIPPLSSNVTDEPEKDIFSNFSTKETMKIISAIFNHDSLDFVNTLERIAECSNEDEANQIIKDVFLSYRANSVGKEAMLLKQKVEQFFRDKEF